MPIDYNIDCIIIQYGYVTLKFVIFERIQDICTLYTYMDNNEV